MTETAPLGSNPQGQSDSNLPPPAFTALPVQERLFKAALEDGFKIIGFGGAIRGTKTWGSLALIILLCRIFPRSRWAVVRKDLPRLRQNTVPSFNKLRELTGGFVGEINQSTWTSTCRNGSVIIFFSESLDIDPDLSRWKGLEVNGFLLEESDELAERSYIKAIERAGTWIVPPKTVGGKAEQPPPYVICTFNPCANWPKRVFYEPWKAGSIAHPYAFIPATAADNPYVSAEQRESWKAMPEHEYRRFVLGDWETLAGRYYEGLNAQVHLVQRETLPDQLPSWWEYWGAYDWGYAHWSTYGSFCKTPDGLIILLDTIWMRREQDYDMADTIRQLSASPLSLKEVYAGQDCWNKVRAHEASGVTTAQIFYERGVWLAKADTDKVNGGRALRRALAVDARTKRPMFVMVDTPGNRRVFDQLAEVMPDPNNINKPEKVDADQEGRGGDDGADMCRFGVATRLPAPTEPDAAWKPGQNQDPNKWEQYAMVEREAGRGRKRPDDERFDQGAAAQLPVDW